MSGCTICGAPVDARGWCHTHYERWRRNDTTDVVGRTYPSVLDRFLAKIAPQPNGCHLWTGAKDGNGYGLFRGPVRMLRAHIFAWEHANHRPVPDGLELDHFACDTPSCANPAHVRPVTSRENSLRSERNACAVNARKTACKRGHPFDEDNTITNERGHRRCRTCLRARLATLR